MKHNYADLLLLDGGLASELAHRGYDVSSNLWSAKLLQSAPEAIEQVHYDYFAAGARCAITASYQASFEGFAAIGVSRDECARLLQSSVDLAMQARARYLRAHPKTGRLLVAASVGPYGAISHDGAEYRGDYGRSVDELMAFHEPRLQILANSGAELLACETLPLLDEARALVALLSRNRTWRAWLSFTSPDGIHTAHGELLSECAQLAQRSSNVIAVGVNCVAPQVVTRAIRELKAVTDKPVIVYPNSGEHWDAASRDWHNAASVGGIAALASEWVQHGARLIGGCCRTGPRDIAALHAVLGLE